MHGDPNDVIEAGGPPGPRRWIAVAVLAAIVAVPVVSLLVGRDPDPPSSLPAPASTPDAAPATSAAVVDAPVNVLHPKPRRKGDRDVLDVVFPDGSKAEIDYPAELDLAGQGVRPALGGWLEGYFSLFRQLTVPLGGAAEVAQGRPMIRRLAGRATLWQPMSRQEGQAVMFDFDPWHVTLRDHKDGMTYEQRLLWAERLRGRTTKNGYLVLDAASPVRLAEPGQVFRGELAGPRLWFGGAVERGEPVLVLAPAPRCDVEAIGVPEIDQGPGFSTETCENGVYMAASGERGSVERMIADVKVRMTR
ncbi:hypothetical protein [Streptosporangium carneum]|uniref:Uncharacterized protein n=1 Tax=Streptosporangium carneum TaxID=47481 RepID=A0A9W6MGC4_9ACTN|nr:hypothetical protein [Streptosporangium carneum]GLK13017.1 hypothetical protein GCM10017600_64280 [Streptosporangium carneum]